MATKKNKTIRESRPVTQEELRAVTGESGNEYDQRMIIKGTEIDGKEAASFNPGAILNYLEVTNASLSRLLNLFSTGIELCKGNLRFGELYTNLADITTDQRATAYIKKIMGQIEETQHVLDTMTKVSKGLESLQSDYEIAKEQTAAAIEIMMTVIDHPDDFQLVRAETSSDTGKQAPTEIDS